MRLFIALPISKKIKKEIDNHIKEITKIKKAKFVPSYNWHFTLVFLGEQNERVIPNIKKALEDTVNNWEAPAVQLKKLTYGPNLNNPRMIWVRTDKESDKEMGKLKDELVFSLEKQNVSWRKSSYKFKGHITLARLKSKNTEKMPNIESEIKASYKPSSLKLIKSTLTKHGAQYEKIKEAKL